MQPQAPRRQPIPVSSFPHTFVFSSAGRTIGQSDISLFRRSREKSERKRSFWRNPPCKICTRRDGGTILACMNTLPRRTVLGAIAAAPLATAARAQDFPDKPLRFVVG